jgi:hypothetical protein
MLEFKKTALTLEKDELFALEHILIDRDEKKAFAFLKNSIYDKTVRLQQGR